MAGDDRQIEVALFDIDNPEALADLLAGRAKNLGICIMGSDGTKIYPIKTNNEGELIINLEASSITIGDVRIKDAVGSFYADVNDANTARTTGTKVIAVQSLDEAGNVLKTSLLATAAKQPALGTGSMVGSSPFTLAIDDTQFGAIGSAAAIAGNIHAQLRAIGIALEIMDDWDESDRAKVNIIAGQVGVAGGAGAISALTLRTIMANDDPASVAIQLISETIGTEAATAALKSLLMGGKHEVTLTELADGQQGDIAVGPFRRIITSNNDASQNVNQVQDATTVSGVPMTPGEQTTLTAPGDGNAENVKGYKNHTWAVTIVLNTCDSVDVAIHGKLKDSAYGNVEGSNPPVDTTWSADGTFFMTAPDIGFVSMKPVFVSEAGDTDSTVTFEYVGCN
ncbi:MAG: hypothetical protein ACTSO3_01115 [Candidatus Heimdallarchaeaceae archaeon]